MLRELFIMQVSFVSNFLSIHQLELCTAFTSSPDVKFKFISCYGPNGFKKNLSNNENEPYVIKVYNSIQDKQKAIDWINDSDLVIFGSGDLYLLRNYKNLIFFYSEHFSKDNLFLLRAFHVHSLYKDFKNSYLLCASSRAQSDYNLARLFINKCIYFGYFIKPNYNPKKNYIPTSSKKYLWAGRDVDFKRLYLAFFAAKTLYKKYNDFELTIVTSNNFSLNKLIKKYKNRPWFKKINFIDHLSNIKLREKMEESDFFLFTSNKGEGWGAVLNEAMAEGCCCVACSLAGSTNYLIDNNENGFIFKRKKEFSSVLYKVHNLKLSEYNRISMKAAKTIQNVWNAENAVHNLLKTYQDISSSKKLVTKKEPGYYIFTSK